MKGSRRKSREAAIQGLYEWRLTANPIESIEASIKESEEYAEFDCEHFQALLRGVIADFDSLKAVIEPRLDRSFDEVSPVEASVLLLAAYELKHHLEIPYRVVINEAIELTKRYGGTDGHKYVNGVLDKLSIELRPSEPKKR